jgi:molybdenum cofactor cytidylyltransferase
VQTIQNKHAAVILAAGSSLRMGTPKLHLKLPCGNTFFESIVNVFVQFGCREVVVVVNADGMAALEKKESLWPGLLRLVINPHPERGRFYSLQQGLAALESPAPVFMHNVDTPLISREVLEALSNRAGEADYICPSFKGQHGHPVLLSEKATAGVSQTSPPFPNLRDFFNLFEKAVVPVNDANILLNVNDPGAFQKMLQSG